MRGNRSNGTRPEEAVGAWLSAIGLRPRRQHPLPIARRTADFAWPGRRVAVFVDGCFWHMCPEHFATPVAHAGYWGPKLNANAARDRDTDARLGALGWRVVRVWEHEPAAAAAVRIRDLLQGAPRDP